MNSRAFTIGRLADAADVHVETVRYYQRRGLLCEPERPAGGVRRYGDDDVERLQFIRRAKAMGFSLQEIADLLTLAGERSCEGTRQLTERKLADVRRRILEMQELEADLERKVALCVGAMTGEGCPTLVALEGRSAAHPAVEQ